MVQTKVRHIQTSTSLNIDLSIQTNISDYLQIFATFDSNITCIFKHGVEARSCVAYITICVILIPSLATTVHFSALAFIRGSSPKPGPNLWALTGGTRLIF